MKKIKILKLSNRFFYFVIALVALFLFVSVLDFFSHSDIYHVFSSLDVDLTITELVSYSVIVLLLSFLFIAVIVFLDLAFDKKYITDILLKQLIFWLSIELSLMLMFYFFGTFSNIEVSSRTKFLVICIFSISNMILLPTALLIIKLFEKKFKKTEIKYVSSSRRYE